MSRSLSLTANLTLVLLCLCACGGGGTNAASGGDTLRLSYARGLTIVRYEGYTVASVADPWHAGKTLHTYLLVPKDSVLPSGMPSGTVVRTPLSRQVVLSTVHSSLLMMLGAERSIVGVCDLQYVDIPWVREQCRLGRIADCGSSLSPDIERMVDAKADALLVSPFENSGGYGKLVGTGIPIVECADYMEQTPLGRAEWMRFFGILTGHEREADSLFAVVEHNYNSLKREAQKTKTRPSVVMDKRTGTVWYVPGGHSTIGQMIADAAGRYVYADTEQSGSLSLPFESVLDKAGEADIWMFRYASDHPVTYAELAAEYAGYKQMRAFKTRCAYGCNTQTSRFFDETPFRPDLLLSDFIAVLHPETGGKLRYFTPVLTSER